MKKILFVLVSLVSMLCVSCSNKYKEISVLIFDGQFGNYVTTNVGERNDLPQDKELMSLKQCYKGIGETDTSLKLKSVYLIVVEKELTDEIIKCDNYQELIKLAKQNNYFSDGLAIYRIY